MTSNASLLSQMGGTVGAILAAMALVALLEIVIPLHARNRWNRLHLSPNLTLTLLTFVTNALFNTALVMALVWLQQAGWGLLNRLSWAPWVSITVVVVALDFSYYLAHVGMHKVPLLWRFHHVHHSDPAVDVTTSIRQHPGEGVIRYLVLFVSACALGASPAAFAVYRVASALNALLEHANIRLPIWLDDLLSLVTTWPNVHKVHHSRLLHETDSNYANLFSLWDRVFGTFTPSRRGALVNTGLDGFDEPALQTTSALMRAPFATRPQQG